MKKFEVITLAQSYASYKDTARSHEYHGAIDGYACGWQFEVVRDGRYEYTSVGFGWGDAASYIEASHALDPMYGVLAFMADGWDLTGRIVFRGYYEEHYDCDAREYYYTDVNEDDILFAISCGNASREVVLETEDDEDEVDEYDDLYADFE